MIDEESTADLGPGMNLNPREQAIKMGKQSSQEEKFMRPKEMGYAMEPQGVQSGIAEYNL